jgi:predicted phosphodiesterase
LASFRIRSSVAILFLAALFLAAASAPPDSFRFIVLGDRTGEAQPGIYERVWSESARLDPAFVVSVGDSIEGLDDATAATEWGQLRQVLAPWRRVPFYLAPGNHDIWSAASENLFRKYAGHPPHYGFDYAQAHFTVLDNSRTEQFSADEVSFLEQDLEAHAAQPLKFIVSHRPSWILNALMDDTNFPLHRLARKYGVQYVIAGHLHQMLHYHLDGVDYVSMVSSGGHLRTAEKYEAGWFFGYAAVEVRGRQVDFRIHELNGRVTQLEDWGKAGLKR